MRRVVLGTVLVATVVLAENAAQGAPGLIGKWLATTKTIKGKTYPPPKGIRVTVEFLKGGRFIGVAEVTSPAGKIRKMVEEGRWKVDGDTLTTASRKTREKRGRMTYRVKGRTLFLIKPNVEEVRLTRLK